MSVLLALVERGCGIVSRDHLITAVWKHRHVSDEALSRCISILRRALGDDAAEPCMLQTLPRRGYRLMVPARALPSPANTDTANAEPASIVVLPFQNLSGKPDEEHVADGLTELLICNLASRPSLRVISRTSSMHYKRSTAPLTEIARELKVTYAVEGSVLRSERNLQVVVQLIDARTDAHRFSRSYTRAFADLLPLQNEIAWAVAEAVSQAFAGAEQGGGDAAPAREQGADAGRLSEDTLQTYLRARFLWSQRTPDAFVRAIGEFEACIAAAPEFAPAHAGLADTLLIMALYGVVKPAEVSERARRCVERALELDPASAEAMTARGGVALFLDWDPALAALWFRRALAINPSHDVARLGLADTLMFERDFDAGLRELKAAIRVNPFDLGLAMNEGEFLIWARRPQEAIVALQKTLDIGPHFWPARLRLARVLAASGERVGALRELERALELAPPARRQAAQALVLAGLGDDAAARRVLVALEATPDQRIVPALDLARAYGMLGDAERALHWIDVAIEERSPMVLALDIDVSFDQIRGDVGFEQLLMRRRQAAPATAPHRPARR